MRWIFNCPTPEDTKKFGALIGKLVKGGELICLQGELGAGKTILTQGIAVGMGVKEQVNSPTFNLVCEYLGHVPLYHMDLYRLDEPEMLFDIGFEEYLGQDGVTVIEWAEKAGPFLPDERLWITVRKGGSDESDNVDRMRTMTLTAVGSRHQQLLKGMIEHVGIGA